MNTRGACTCPWTRWRRSSRPRARGSGPGRTAGGLAMLARSVRLGALGLVVLEPSSPDRASLGG
eukprot:1640186-Prymnesium_polylepis.1